MRLPHTICNVKLDMLPVNSKEVMLSRDHITMVILGEEEKEYDREQKDTENVVDKCVLALQISQSQYVKDSIDVLNLLDATAKKTAKSFTYRFRPKNIHSVEWNFLRDNKQISARPMEKNAKEQKKVSAVQAKKSTILLMTNGRQSGSKKSKHIENNYFVIFHKVPKEIFRLNMRELISCGLIVS